MKVAVADVGVRISRNLKEELAWTVDKNELLVLKKQ